MASYTILCRSRSDIREHSTHNDAFHSGTFAKGLGAVDLYMWDQYPQGFACSNPTSWPEVNSVNQDTEHQVCAVDHLWYCSRESKLYVQRFNPDQLWATGEFQGGAFDPWGGVRRLFLGMYWHRLTSISFSLDTMLVLF